MSRYLQQLVQRAAGQGPWAAVAPSRMPGPPLDLPRRGQPPAEPGPSPALHRERDASGVAPALPERVVPDQLPAATVGATPSADMAPGGSETVGLIADEAKPTLTPLPAAAAEVSLSGSVTRHSTTGVQAAEPSTRTESRTAGSGEQPSPVVAQPASVPDVPQAAVVARSRGEAARVPPGPAVAQPAQTAARLSVAARHTGPSDKPGEHGPRPTVQPLSPRPATARMIPAGTGPSQDPGQDPARWSGSPPQPPTAVITSANKPPPVAARPQTEGLQPVAARVPDPAPQTVQAPRPPPVPTPVPAVTPQARPVPPGVQVRIGRVEVKAAAAQQQQAPPAAPARRAGGFDDYLALRSYHRQDY